MSDADVRQCSDVQWAVAIFSSRENAEVLWRVVSSARRACSKLVAVVDVLINGNRALADEIVALAEADTGTRSGHLAGLRVWSFDLADKSFAWNTYIHALAPNASFVFFVDGYAEFESDALQHLARAFQRNERALAASGVPTLGPSARRLQRTMQTEGGIHGNLYALSGDCLRRLRASNFRLPLGLYRTDPLLGAALCFNLDPPNNVWDASRIAVVPEATWNYPVPKFWRWRDWRSFFKRRMRQAQGDAENSAVRRLFAVERRTVDCLPASTKGLIGDWIEAVPAEASRLFRRRPLVWFAWKKLLKAPDLNAANQTPKMLYSRDPVAGSL